MFSRSEIDAYKHQMDLLWSSQQPDQIPNGSMWFSESFAIRNAGQNIAEVFHQPEVIYDAVLWAASQYGWNPFLQFSGFSVLGAIDFGGKMYYPQDECEVLAPDSHPITGEADIDALKFPDPETTGDIPRQLQFAHLQQKAGFPVTFFSRSPFCMAANMCGVGLFMKWLLRRPDLCTRVLDLALKHILNCLEYWITKFGAKNIQVWMSTPLESNQCISPKHLQAFALPYHEAYHDYLKKRGLKRFCLHICGEQNLNLEALSEAAPWPHPSVLSFGKEVDITRAAKLFPNDIICGNIDTELLQLGSPAAVYNACCDILKKGKRIETGFILAPGCDTPGFAPPANLFAMSKALEACGSY